LTEDPELVKRQLVGEDLPWDTSNPQNNPKLRDDISTDEITPAHICFYFDETLGEFPYTGLKCGNELPIKRGGAADLCVPSAESVAARDQAASSRHMPNVLLEFSS
jgi:3-isopropylmalate/(R)-2-methylmalate dehydratase large subunit